MNARIIQEPSLEFGEGHHLCPRSGIYTYSPYDLNDVRPEKITLGIIGLSESIEKVTEWLEECSNHIPGKISKNPHPNLFMNFCGFNTTIGFKSEIVYDEGYCRKLNQSDISEFLKSNLERHELIQKIADLYLDEIKYLSQNKRPDVIISALSDEILAAVIESENNENEAEQDKGSSQVPAQQEVNFRRYLKARAMKYHIPIQIMRDRITSAGSGMQDAATIAWNFFTALYYKASGTPWALIRKDFAHSTCYVGISFYKSLDRASTQTSIAQIFNEYGKGVILRGEEVEMKKDDRTPHMSEEHAYSLLTKSLSEYFSSIKTYPKRLVVHKTSNFTADETYGMKQAAKEKNIFQIDLISIQQSKIRLYRNAEYPPLRGTQVNLDKKRHLLYTRGSVPYFETYTGMYIPGPLEVRLFEHDESPNLICEEILALTKMNWNNTQFDRKFPITIECSRNVGEILKYLQPEDDMQLKYSFYM
jgi:hypothetical protein